MGKDCNLMDIEQIKLLEELYNSNGIMDKSVQ